MCSDKVFLTRQAGGFGIQVNPAKDVRAMNSERLLENAEKLDLQALAQLHDRYYPSVYRYVRYRLDNDLVVEDISSEVFLRLLDHLHKQKGEIHDLRAWLFGTAANMINDHLRQRYRRPTENLDAHESLTSGEDPHWTAEQNENQRAVHQAIQHLTQEQQHVLALRFSQGFSVEETAQTMNKTIGAVKVLQFRALAAMRKMLTGEKKI